MWKWSGIASGGNDKEQCLHSGYRTLLDKYSAKATTIPYFRLCANSLVVVQEFSLVAFVIASHQVATESTKALSCSLFLANGIRNGGVWDNNFVALVEMDLISLNPTLRGAILILLFTFFVFAIITRRMKLSLRHIVRFLAATFVLRIIALVSRCLVSLCSISESMIAALIFAGMTIHLFMQDYSYANGIGPEPIKPPMMADWFSFKNASLLASIFASSQTNSVMPMFMAVFIFMEFPHFRFHLSKTYPAHLSGTCTLVLKVVSHSPF